MMQALFGGLAIIFEAGKFTLGTNMVSVVHTGTTPGP